MNASTHKLPNRHQDLKRFQMGSEGRGRGVLVVQLWGLVQATLFRLSPKICFGWRRFLLRLFGARIGRGVLLRPSAEVTYPWKVSIGDYCWIGDHAVLYSLGDITIGSHTVVSQRSYLCAATHATDDVLFAQYARPVKIGSECWLAADVYVAPGISIGDGTVVGARSTVLHDLPPDMICYGYPARPVRPRASEQCTRSHNDDACHDAERRPLIAARTATP
jgi:putative colanic acid biosynthesis acetyltransferase WcaF